MKKIADSIVEGEMEYFSPMLDRAQRSSEADRLIWSGIVGVEKMKSYLEGMQ